METTPTETMPPAVPLQKRPSIIEQYNELSKDQDFQQKMTVTTTLILEVYRVLMGAMLILFVPQNCDGEMCSLSGNFYRDDNGLTKTAFALNLFTVASFLVLYKIEVTRENKMINYLNVNPELPRDDDAVKEALEQLEISKKEEIWTLDKHYQQAGYFSMGAFSINSALSSYVIFTNFLNDKTLTVLFTNLLFMGLKINDVFTVVKTDKNIFLSAYLTRKIQYNDIDPDHCPKEEKDIESATSNENQVPDQTIVEA